MGAQHGHSVSTPLYPSYFIYYHSLHLFLCFISLFYNEVICMKKISYKLKLSNIKTPHKHKQIHNHTHIHPPTLHSLQLSQCRVGEQSLGKRTRSLGANVVVRETCTGGWGGVSTVEALCLYPIVFLLF